MCMFGLISVSGPVLKPVEFLFIEDEQSDVVVKVNSKMNPVKCETTEEMVYME